MRKAIWCGVGKAATLAVASCAAADEAEEPAEYVVAVAKLNLRAGPSPSGTPRMGGNG